MKSNVKSPLERAIQFSIDNSPKGFIVPQSALEQNSELVKKVTTATYVIVERCGFAWHAKRRTMLELVDILPNNLFYLSPVPKSISSAVRKGMRNWDKALQIFYKPGFFDCIPEDIWSTRFSKFWENGGLFIFDNDEVWERFKQLKKGMEEPKAGTWGGNNG